MGLPHGNWGAVGAAVAAAHLYTGGDEAAVARAIGNGSRVTPPRCCAWKRAAIPHDPELIRLIGELSTHSGIFRPRWASHDVQFHRSGRKRLRHPVVGELDLNFESMELPSEPCLTINV